MFQFSIMRLLFAMVLVAFLIASLQEESLLSGARLLGGALAVFLIPKTFMIGCVWLRREFGSSRQPEGDSKVFAVQPVYIGFILVVSLGSLSIFGLSVAGEAWQYTTGLTRWLIPIALVAGLVSTMWSALPRRRTASAIDHS